MSQSLVERLGGPNGLRDIIREAYQRVMAEPELKPFFEDVDTAKIQRMQQVFLEAALTDDTDIADTGISIHRAHSGLNITRHHFSLFVNCFLEALEAIDTVKSDDIDQVIGRLNTYSNDVLGTTSIDG